MATEVRDNPEQSRYEIVVDGTVAGFTQYRPEGDALAFPHTEVDPAYAGQGLSKVLIAGALDDVRARGGAVLPYCPAVRGYIAKNPAYVDLVPESARATFGL